nr:cytochrome c3 family protein [candidate division Zixibacteria bacterium]
MKNLAILMMAVSLLFVFTMVWASEEKPKHDFAGVDKCKICHKKDGVYPSWLETKHAKAWESLDEKAQKNEKCIGCHSTGTTTEGELLTGVQCEACHGAGNDYKKMSIMKDREQAIANGLLIPDENTCKKCHNENVPEEFRPKEAYNFAEMMKTGIHAKPVKEEKKEATEGK